MPTYRSVNISLHSQFDVETLPEYHPVPQESRTVPKLIDNESSTCSVYIPVLPGSTFWIGYSVSPPVPDDHYFLCKLYINGAHVVSWSTGKDEGWAGKIMFGLYERPEDAEGKKKVEKRVLRFTPSGSEGRAWENLHDPFDDKACMEIKVHRAHGRKRIEREMEVYSKTQHAGAVQGIDLVNAGCAPAEQPKRFYKFALIDPIDQPFATFRYLYRTWEQLQDLGVLDHRVRSTTTEDDMPVIEPCEDSEDSRNVSRASEEDIHESSNEVTSLNRHPTRLSAPAHRAWEGGGRCPAPGGTKGLLKARQPLTYMPRGAPKTIRQVSDEQVDGQTQQRSSYTHTPPHLYRHATPQSVTPSRGQQDPRPLPHIPHKVDTSCSNRPPTYPVEGWRMQTPDPVKSTSNGLFTPPALQGFRTSSLMGALSSTFKRRGRSSSGSRGGADSHNSG